MRAADCKKLSESPEGVFRQSERRTRLGAPSAYFCPSQKGSGLSQFLQSPEQSRGLN